MLQDIIKILFREAYYYYSFLLFSSIVLKNYLGRNYTVITLISNNKKICLVEEDKESKLRITVRNYRNIGSMSADWRGPW